MSGPPFQRLEELFHRALALPESERAVFLDRECAGEAILRAALEDLLRHDAPSETDRLMVSPIKRTTTPIIQAGSTTEKGLGDASLEAPVDPSGIPGYQILGELGRGGMGVVFKARQISLDRLVAIKMSLSVGAVTANQLARFRLEAESLARLQHPNIVQIYEIGEYRGVPYFVMEYVDGPSLAHVAAGLPQPIQASAHLVETLARAMAAVHVHGLIHRDLKPANVLLQMKDQAWEGASAKQKEQAPFAILDSGTFIPKITDFGIAKRLQGAGLTTLTGAVIGTPSYMAPEQARADQEALGPGVDIYALGTILYELLTGRPPFEGASAAETYVRILNEEPISPTQWRPGLPRDLATICLKCLEKDARKRYTTAGELGDDLRRFQSGEPIKARPVGFIGSAWRWCRRQPIAATALAVAGTLAVVLVVTVLVYNARLSKALAESRRLAEERRQQILSLDITIGDRELENGDAFTALLWLSQALRLDEPESEDARVHRQRVISLLSRLPRLAQLETCPGRVVAAHCTSKGCWLAVQAPDHRVIIWDVMADRPVGDPIPHNKEVQAAAFAGSDVERLVIAIDDEGIHICEPRTGKSTPMELGTNSPLKRLVSHADGRLLLMQHADFSLHLRDMHSGKPVAMPDSLSRPQQFSLVSDDGRWALAVDKDGHGRLWNVTSAAPIAIPMKLQDTLVGGALSSDGRLAALLTSDNSLRILETRTGRLSLPSIPRDTTGRFMKFNPDGHFLLAAGAVDRLFVWNTEKGEPAIPPLHHRGTIEQAVFSEDGRKILVVDGTHCVRLWEIPSARRLDQELAQMRASDLVNLAELVCSAAVDDHATLAALDNDSLLRHWRLARLTTDRNVGATNKP
jgi:serine/threonine protein kinase/WD40 repeat protein